MQIKSPLVSKIIDTDKWRNEEMLSETGRIYTFLNPVSYLQALDNIELYSVFDGLYSDGAILVAAIRLIYFKKIWRQSFDMTSLAPKFFKYAERNNKSVCIVASKQEELEKAIEKFCAEYPNIKWSLCRNGYFCTYNEMASYAELIASEQPDFVIAGLGAGKQEQFLLLCKQKGFKGIGFTCGGFIHQFAINEYIHYYPKWIDKYDLRFVYRFIKEKHTRKRYVVAAFIFPYKFIRERIKYLF